MDPFDSIEDIPTSKSLNDAQDEDTGDVQEADTESHQEEATASVQGEGRDDVQDEYRSESLCLSSDDDVLNLSISEN